MASTYGRLIQDNLQRAFAGGLQDVCRRTGGRPEDGRVAFSAFGAACRIGPDGIELDGRPETGPAGVVLSLYARCAADEPCRIEPFSAYRQFADTMPYVAAFSARTEAPLAAVAGKLVAGGAQVAAAFDGRMLDLASGADVCLLLYPVPKVALCYQVWTADEDFPASATCLFSANADRFLPPDGLADLGEYTTAAVCRLLES